MPPPTTPSTSPASPRTPVKKKFAHAMPSSSRTPKTRAWPSSTARKSCRSPTPPPASSPSARSNQPPPSPKPKQPNPSKKPSPATSAAHAGSASRETYNHKGRQQWRPSYLSSLSYTSQKHCHPERDRRTCVRLCRSFPLLTPKSWVPHPSQPHHEGWDRPSTTPLGLKLRSEGAASSFLWPSTPYSLHPNPCFQLSLHLPSPALHRLRPIPQKSLHHLLRLHPQRRLLKRKRRQTLYRRTPHDVALILFQQRHRPGNPQTLCAGLGNPWHNQPQVPPRSRFTRRQGLQQPIQLIDIRLEQTPIDLGDPPRHIGRPLPHLNLFAEQLANQRPNRHLAAANLPSNRPRQSQPPSWPTKLSLQRLHARKYRGPA